MTESLTMFEGEQAIAFMEVCQERDILALKLAVALEQKEMATAEAAVLFKTVRSMKRHQYINAGHNSVDAECLADAAMEREAPLASAHLALHRRLVEGQRTWQRDEVAPEDVHFTANIVRPKLGQACLQACMSHNGVRYAFIFDNPEANGYVWMELPEIRAGANP